MHRLALAAGHADRVVPLKNYCTGLLLPGQRKSVEPMAARLAPDNVRRTHQSLHHFVADAPWKDEAILQQVRGYVLPAMQKQSPVVAWIVDETSFVKKGTHSVGVARQYCGRLGKKENCQVAVSLSVATAAASLPLAWRLYLPESWAGDAERREAAGVPADIPFQTKPQIALEQIRQAVRRGVVDGVVLADEVYGVDRGFRAGLRSLELEYVVAVRSSTTVWGPGQQPLPPKPWRGRGRPARRVRRDQHHQPVSVEALARALPERAWQEISWREGSRQKLASRFAAVRVVAAYGDDQKVEPHPEEWLLVEWPEEEPAPVAYWLSNLPANWKRKPLVAIAKHRWVIERDYEELKQELGLGHYEGRGWRGFHHHATLCIAAYGFLMAERSRFFPSAHVGHGGLSVPALPPDFRPRGSPRTPRAA